MIHIQNVVRIYGVDIERVFGDKELYCLAIITKMKLINLAWQMGYTIITLLLLSVRVLVAKCSNKFIHEPFKQRQMINLAKCVVVVVIVTQLPAKTNWKLFQNENECHIEHYNLSQTTTFFSFFFWTCFHSFVLISTSLLFSFCFYQMQEQWKT